MSHREGGGRVRKVPKSVTHVLFQWPARPLTTGLTIMSTGVMLSKESNKIVFSKGNIFVNSNVHFNVDRVPKGRVTGTDFISGM
jgi:hypothetical protein